MAGRRGRPRGLLHLPRRKAVRRGRFAAGGRRSAPAAAGSPLPVVLRADARGSVWALFTVTRKLALLDARGAPQGELQPIESAAGGLFGLAITPRGPLPISEKPCLKPLTSLPAPRR